MQFICKRIQAIWMPHLIGSPFYFASFNITTIVAAITTAIATVSTTASKVYERECQDALFSTSLNGPWVRRWHLRMSLCVCVCVTAAAVVLVMRQR